MDREWAPLCLCLAERWNQLPTLRPTASPSQPDRRLRGQTKIYLLPLPLTLGVVDGHAHTYKHTDSTREGLLHPGTSQSAWGNAGGSVTLSGFCRICLPHRTWPRLILRFICIPRAPAWQMVGEEAGCVLGAAARDQAGPGGPQSTVPTRRAPWALAQAGAHSSCWGTSSPSQTLRGART